MNYSLFPKVTAAFLLVFSYIPGFSNEENFLLINGKTDEIVLELGPHINKRISPCSSFKIALSLMGYDAGILKNEMNPVWDFQEGYEDWLESWRAPLTPESWMKFSCVWYSKLLALHLGMEKIQNYLAAFEYGNQNITVGLAPPGDKTHAAWINSSLTISPKEQVDFIQNMILGKLCISNDAVAITKVILFKEELSEGWKLFGKTGWSGSDITKDGETLEHSWFVGWIEKNHHFYPFAYLIRDKKIDLNQRIPRVKQLLVQSNVLTEILID